MYMWRERSKEEKHEDVVNTGLLPLDVVEGFKIRPGFFRMYGACVASNGVSFTINSHGATRCTLFIVHRHQNRMRGFRFLIHIG